MTSKNISIRKGSVLNSDFENWTHFSISFETIIKSYGSADHRGSGFFSFGEESYNRYLWKSLIGEVRAVHLCFSLQPLHDFNATHLCIAASRLYFISFPLLSSDGGLHDDWSQKGLLKVTWSKNLLPAGSHVRSHWVPHSFRCLMLVFFPLWFTGCEKARGGFKLLWVESVQREQDSTWSVAVLVHGAQPSTCECVKLPLCAAFPWFH